MIVIKSLTFNSKKICCKQILIKEIIFKLTTIINFLIVNMMTNLTDYLYNLIN